MKYLLIICVVFLGCTDNRPLDSDDFELSPRFEVNLFQIQYPALLINVGNNSIPSPNTIRQFVNTDFLNEQFNADYLKSLEFKFLAENSIDTPQTFEFIFFDADGVETLTITHSIEEGDESTPKTGRFANLYTTQSDIEKITNSVELEVVFSQPLSADNNGIMNLECVIEASYLYTKG
ncbi:hypothetical protein [Psychroflexus sp. MES1-P1E]|uniref:hypothetical protein n=1 Tax=Psychroflexus sp. MES1-P1E TaxID=2058320 RepID=UPI000C7AF49C|nr:hypothetical protein [Psychroflexus sp. MES1-P1E]PKG41276.1 hypothetical protein CXF67_15770 [Psychroflexus sp. MES1-P1E]